MHKVLKQTNRWAPIAIALSALFLTIYHGNLARLHNKISLEPHLNIGYFSNDESAGFALYSNGLGPAVVKWMTVSVDDSDKQNWNEVTEALGFSPSVDYIFGYLFPENFVKADFVSNLYKVEARKDILHLNKSFRRVTIAICYCSVYGDIDKRQCWQASNDTRYEKRQCDKAPEFSFATSMNDDLR